MEQLATCVVCGAPSTSATVVHRRSDDALVRCRGCGIVFANPQYTPEELAPLYREEYYDEHKNFETDFRERDAVDHAVLDRAVLDDLLRRYPRLRPEPERSVRVLDYGCGVGFFLVECRRQGLTPMGTDFSEVAARYARERYQLDVRPDPDQMIAELPAGSFELITAWQVIEHVRRPREVLRAFTRLLAPGGVLAIAVPQLEALGHRVRGARWFNVQNRTHLFFFNHRNLERLLVELGLTDVVRARFWGGTPGQGFLGNLAQYALRWMGLNTELRLYAARPRD